MLTDAACVACAARTARRARRTVDPMRKVCAAGLDLCAAALRYIRCARGLVTHALCQIAKRSASASDAGSIVARQARVASLQLRAIALLLIGHAHGGVAL